MNLQYYCPRWGAENTSWDDFCQRVKQVGYDGVESTISEDLEEQKQMLSALKNNDLLLIGQYFQSFEKDFEEHKANYTKWLYRLASVNPVIINAQTGKDYYSFEQNAELFAIAERISQETGISICHETHRNKALFAAHVGYEILQKLPDLKITADFSHWCNVAESLLEDQTDALTFACKKAIHIHARVGHSQSAQVVDPRLPEFKNELEAHLKWWDEIVKNHLNNKTEILTISPEFGPTPYMVHLPFTNLPISSQWDINVFMLHLLKDRYGK